MQLANSFYTAVFDVIQIIECGLEQWWRFFVEDVLSLAQKAVAAPG